MDNEGIFRAPSKKTLSPRKDLVPLRCKIAQWEPSKRVAFEREIVAQQVSIEKIADKYGVSKQTALNWKKRVLKPALAAAQQQVDIEERGKAREYLDWLLNVPKNAIIGLTEGVEVEQVDGTKTRVMHDPKVYGTVAQNVGQAANLVKMLSEFTGEIAEAQRDTAPQGPTVIRAIIMPKIGESMPQMGVEVTLPGRKPPVQLEPVPDDAA